MKEAKNCASTKAITVQSISSFTEQSVVLTVSRIDFELARPHATFKNILYLHRYSDHNCGIRPGEKTGDRTPVTNSHHA